VRLGRDAKSVLERLFQNGADSTVHFPRLFRGYGT